MKPMLRRVLLRVGAAVILLLGMVLAFLLIGTPMCVEGIAPLHVQVDGDQLTAHLGCYDSASAYRNATVREEDGALYIRIIQVPVSPMYPSGSIDVTHTAQRAIEAVYLEDDKSTRQIWPNE